MADLPPPLSPERAFRRSHRFVTINQADTLAFGSVPAGLSAIRRPGDTVRPAGV